MFRPALTCIRQHLRPSHWRCPSLSGMALLPNGDCIACTSCKKAQKSAFRPLIFSKILFLLPTFTLSVYRTTNTLIANHTSLESQDVGGYGSKNLIGYHSRGLMSDVTRNRPPVPLFVVMYLCTTIAKSHLFDTGLIPGKILLHIKSHWGARLIAGAFWFIMTPRIRRSTLILRPHS